MKQKFLLKCHSYPLQIEHENLYEDITVSGVVAGNFQLPLETE
jgi:hypothetical protein